MFLLGIRITITAVWYLSSFNLSFKALARGHLYYFSHTIVSNANLRKSSSNLHFAHPMQNLSTRLFAYACVSIKDTFSIVLNSFAMSIFFISIYTQPVITHWHIRIFLHSFHLNLVLFLLVCCCGLGCCRPTLSSSATNTK